MDSDDHDPVRRQVNALVGSAIKGLVESGADPEFIGEFAASHRTDVARILGHAESAPPVIDLEALVTRSVASALEAAGLTKKPRESRAKTTRVTVKIGSQRTSVTLNKDLVSRLTDVRGSKRDAEQFIEEIANKAPAPPGRSKWVEARVQAFLLSDPGSASSRSTAAH